MGTRSNQYCQTEWFHCNLCSLGGVFLKLPQKEWEGRLLPYKSARIRSLLPVRQSQAKWLLFSTWILKCSIYFQLCWRDTHWQKGSCSKLGEGEVLWGAWHGKVRGWILEGRCTTETEELSLEEVLSVAGQVIESLPRKEGQKGGIAILIS